MFALLGEPDAPDLTQAVVAVLRRLGVAVPVWPVWRPVAAPATPPDAVSTGRTLHGLFSGGTLCDEARRIAAATLDADYYRITDFGADERTQGRPHPMIDNTPRIKALTTTAADPDCASILLDVVLGHAAHPDPAAELAPAIAKALTAARADGHEPAIVVSLCGTTADPQNLDPPSRST